MEEQKKTKKQRVEKIDLPKRSFSVSVGSNAVRIGSGEDIGLISGPCVIDNRSLVFETARQLCEIREKLGIGIIFKSSYEKDNRGSESNWRGPLMDEGLKILKDIRQEFQMPVLTDVHRVEDVDKTADFVDVLQIPAYMCQQTSLALACGKTGKAINVKKGQFLAPETMGGVLGKIQSTGNNNILLTERGSCFGYNRLVADLRAVPIMQELGAPVCVDSTHIIRIYGVPSADPSGGEPRFIPHLTLAGVAAGADALFIEAHPEPMKALCDAASQMQLSQLPYLIQKVQKVRKAIENPESLGTLDSQ